MLTVHNAALRGRSGRWSLTIERGRFTSINPDSGTTPATPALDAGGNLVTEPFVDAHLHLCKVHTLDLAGEGPLNSYTAGTMGAAMDAIDGAAAVKTHQTEEAVTERARSALVESVRHGVRAVQAFADVDPVAGLTGVKALLTLKSEFAHLVDVRVVAFPQDGLLKAPGTEALIEEAVELGADVVGGIPWIEFTDADATEHVRRMVALAKRTGKRIAMLVDDAGDPGLRTTEALATELIAQGMTGRASAQHARAMALYPEPYLRRLSGLIKRAGLSLVSDPHTGPLHLPVLPLTDDGIPVALGQDDIEDAYYPFGRHNLLEVAFLAAHLLGPSRLDDLYDMITTTAAKVIGRESEGLRVGAVADLVVLDGPTIREALTRHSPPRHVVVGGEVIASTKSETLFPGFTGKSA
ncbi:amidohydrolase family protein [Herbidospora sp. RD11066]